MLDISVLESLLPAVAMLAARLSGLFATAPFLSGRYIPVQVKAALVLCLSVALSPVLTAGKPETPGGLAVIALAEILTGMMAGFAASLVFVAVEVAGQVFDTEMGYGMTNVLDPAFGVQVPLMGGFAQLCGLWVFLALDGHHFMLASVLSIPGIAPGRVEHSAMGIVEWVLDRFCESFSLGLRLALPLLVAAFVASAAMGIVSRAVPQFNILVMGMPLRVLLGLAVLAASLPQVLRVLSGAFSDSRYWVPAAVRLLGR